MSHASIATRGRETGGLTFFPPRSYGEEPGIRTMGRAQADWSERDEPERPRSIIAAPSPDV